jgi:hypothetical protein
LARPSEVRGSHAASLIGFVRFVKARATRATAILDRHDVRTPGPWDGRAITGRPCRAATTRSARPSFRTDAHLPPRRRRPPTSEAPWSPPGSSGSAWPSPSWHSQAVWGRQRRPPPRSRSGGSNRCLLEAMRLPRTTRPAPKRRPLCARFRRRRRRRTRPRAVTRPPNTGLCVGVPITLRPVNTGPVPLVELGARPTTEVSSRSARHAETTRTKQYDRLPSELADVLAGDQEPDLARFAALCTSYGVDMDPDSVPGLCERFAVTHPLA